MFSGRRLPLAGVIFLFWFVAAAPLGWGQATYDLLLRGGHVIDPANGIDAVMDVAVSGDRIARVAASIPPSQARKVVDVSGLYVTPGLIDLHTHYYSYSGSILPDDAALPTGTTTAIDLGGPGWRNFEEFKEKIVDRSKTRVLTFINSVGSGMGGDESNVDDMDPVATANKIAEYPDLIVGIKNAHFARPGWVSVERAIEAGRLSGKPVSLDNTILSWTGRDTATKLLEKMRPGDIHTHCYNDRHVEIVNRQTREIQPWAWQARERGVLFDLGHGGGSFVWPVADAAMRGGFPPDTISTDLHAGSILSTESDMPNSISKMMVLGMSLKDAVERSTVRPAQVLRRFPELGTLGEGKEADIAVFKLESGVFSFQDAWGHKRLGDKNLLTMMTLRAGEVVFDREGLSLPEWHTAGLYERIE